MSNEHPMARWAKNKKMPIKTLALVVGCSHAHLINLLAGRKEASLRLAKRLTEVTGGKVPMDSFLRSDE